MSAPTYLFRIAGGFKKAFFIVTGGSPDQAFQPVCTDADGLLNPSVIHTPSAHDVGAYTKAEVDQAIAAAIQAQFGAAFISWFNTLPTTLPSLPGQPWNNGGTLAVS